MIYETEPKLIPICDSYKTLSKHVIYDDGTDEARIPNFSWFKFNRFWLLYWLFFEIIFCINFLIYYELNNFLQKITYTGAYPGLFCLTTYLMYLAHHESEAYNFWKPYMDTFPKSYSTSLDFTDEERKLLKGSSLESTFFLHNFFLTIFSSCTTQNGSSTWRIRSFHEGTFWIVKVFH
jgi:hypothetical protein